MAALNTDKAKKLSRRWVGQIGSGGVADAVVTTIPLASTTNLPTDTAVVVVVDRVDANGVATPTLEETIIGVVSGSNLANAVRGAEGTAQAHNAGAVVEVLVSAKGWNDLVDLLLVQHNQLGLHTNVTACNITASGTLSASHVSACDITTARFITAGTNLTASALDSPSASLPIKILKGTYNTAQTYAPSGAGTTTLDLALGNEHIMTMPAATQTIAISNGTAGQKFIVSINNVTSQGALTWFTTIKWAGGVAPTLTGTNAKRDTFGFIITGSGTYDGFVVGQNI